ncbi:MAG TPA: oxidoreductase [Thermoanaerobaculia bacterium]|nr:oxidoreductase [Thermoanaerobaculia bacterium]
MAAEPMPRTQPELDEEPDLLAPEDSPAAVRPGAEAPRRPRIREFETIVEEAIRETPDTTTLVFFTGSERLEYEAGQFLTIRPHQFPALERFVKYFEDLKGKKEPARAYSMCSAPHERRLAVTVKEELYVSGVTKYPPLMSPFLTYRTPPGTRMVVTGFGGPYTLPRDVESRTDHIVHICAGSGIVPNMSILKHCLDNDMRLRHTLIYGNKTWTDVIFGPQLAELAAKHPGKLEIVHALSRERGDCDIARYGPGVHRGRVSEELIRATINDPLAVEVFTCGPGIGKFERQAAKEKGEAPVPRFLETTLAALKAIGVPNNRVHREMYG